MKTIKEQASKDARRDEYFNKINNKNVQLQAKLETAEVASKGFRQYAQDLREKLKMTEAALLRYGEHETGCMKGDACNCGLDQALGKPKITYTHHDPGCQKGDACECEKGVE